MCFCWRLTPTTALLFLAAATGRSGGGPDLIRVDVYVGDVNTNDGLTVPGDVDGGPGPRARMLTVHGL